MVAVFDVGNTNIHAGLYQGRRLTRRICAPTGDALPATMIGRMLNRKTVEGAAVVSVVPRLTRALVSLCRRQGVRTVVISSRIDCGIKYVYDDPSTLGADRIAAIAGALARYGQDAIIVDAGTAIKIDVALKSGRHLGGLILPGMEMLAEALHEKTAQLPRIIVRKPVNLAGRSTTEGMRSGVFNGTLAMVAGLIRQLKARYGAHFFCVSTGGAGALLARNIPVIDKHDPELCLLGALTIYRRNVRG